MKTLRHTFTAAFTGMALLASTAACAQTQTLPAPVADTKVPAEEVEMAAETAKAPALWKVADEDTTIYLFGTVHLLPDDVNWYSGAIKEALSSSGTLVTEIDMTPEAMSSMGSLVAAKGMLPAGQTLRGLMDDEQRAIYEGGLAKVGIPAAAFDQMEPWLASIAILQVVTQASGYKEEKGAENVLEATIGPDAERVALETIEFQLSVFDELPIDQQLAYLLESAEDPKEGIAILNELVAEWAEGDVEQLAALMNEGFMAHPNLAEKLLYARNRNWAEWIDERMDEPGTVFMAVGAGHLAGEKSVQDYLVERGIQSSRVQ